MVCSIPLLTKAQLAHPTLGGNRNEDCGLDAFEQQSGVALHGQSSTGALGF